MNTTLRYQSTGRGGSFDAWGVGLFYHYDEPENTLSVYCPRNAATPLLLEASLSSHSREHAREFVHYFDKTTQIKALMLSNQTTVNIINTMEYDRLRGVLISTAQLAKSACNLQKQKLNPFVRMSRKDYALKHFNINYLCCQSSGDGYYRARLKTESDNEVVARSITVHGVLMTLSEKIVGDLIALEFTAKNDTAHNLLRFSSQLSTISRALNAHFFPMQKVRAVEMLKAFAKTSA